MRMFAKPAALALSCLVAALLPEPSAATGPQLTLNAPATLSLEYDPFSGHGAQRSLELSVVNAGASAQAVILEITPLDAPSLSLSTEAGHSLPLMLQSGGSRSDLRKLAVPLTLQPGRTPVPLSAVIEPGHVPAAGLARLDLAVRLRDPQGAQAPASLQTLRVEARIPPRAQTNFAGASGGYRNGTTTAQVEFGELRPGGQKRVVLQVRANTAVDMDVRSRHAGALVNQNSPHRVPYTLELDGTQCDLAAPCQLTRTPALSLDGSAYAMEFTLGADMDRIAGQYRDLVTVEVFPR